MCPCGNRRQLALTVPMTGLADTFPIALPQCCGQCFKCPLPKKPSPPSFNSLEKRLLLKLWCVVEWAQREGVFKLGLQSDGELMYPELLSQLASAFAWFFFAPNVA